MYVDHLCGKEDSNGRSVEYMRFLQCTSSRFLSVLSVGARLHDRVIYSKDHAKFYAMREEFLSYTLITSCLLQL